jgi:hypothetical protein
MNTSNLRVWLDDEPDAPARASMFPASEGWVHCRWPAEVIEHLKTGQVGELSLDNDLGEGSECAKPRTGLDVLTWLEKEVGYGRWTRPLPRIRIHTQNPVAREAMKAALRNIHRLLALSGTVA